MELPQHDPQALKALFAAEPLAERSFGLDYTYGFILAMVSAPDLIEPSEWLPLLFKSEELPDLKSKKQMERVMGGLLSIWSYWAKETEDSDTLPLPPECGLDADGFPSAALEGFCRGYLEGSEWLREVWDEALEEYGPESAEEKISGTALFVCLRLYKAKQPPVDAEAARAFEAVPVAEAWERLPLALNDVAALGRALHMQRLRPKEPVRSAPKPGRNDPCPCGSGKKYKKCCLK